ncbi:uncharacterized protein LOC100892542 [Strongylocentrotus purpuratus]|uniref:SCP domain-containing protein n=1 Tax=Strongylocentrotus purpuratus TaxID=7668 RepID=A0A7M7HNQ3_STRPU|nr:uncharacterized protein LOC100892542 [Strongylocentrotus purpuratus]XP_003726111.2 uncharacterized protein LOC100892542 [Strongylocentrotus purpuratus]XP_011676575.2 uncharacterized protein LOC100892542 [Strongylocentrotus purpuratus]
MSKKSDLKSFRKEALSSHNKYRDVHGVSSLKLSDDLNDHAQRWAEHLSQSGKFSHSNNRELGENIGMHYSSASTEFSGQDATDLWYQESSKYDFSSPGFRQGTGHFSQIVWKSSKEFGIGKAVTKDGKVIIVGNYKPPGNMSGNFPENVFPPLAEKIEKKKKKEEKKKGRRGSISSSSSSSSSSSDDDTKTKGVLRKKSKKSSGLPKVSRSEHKDFSKQAMTSHNEYRRHHGAPPLEQSRDLQKRARKWAKHLAKHDLFEHSKANDIGENVAMHYSSLSTEYSGKEAAAHWYSEIHNYDFKKPGFTKGAGHFTQMVWKGSREFGIGKAITRDGKVIIVGQYRPPGNIIDHFEGNVSKRDDGYMPPPPPEKESSQVTRVVRSTEYESGPSREVKAAEVNDTIKKMGGMKLKEADVSPADLKTFQKDTLAALNKIRQKHSVSKLKQADELEKRAQDFAAQLAKKDEFKNSSEKDVGENIAMHYNSASTEFSGQEVVDMWYKQIDKYDFKKPGFTSGAGHFTQMVWKGSQEFGIGKSITKEGKVLTVAFFRPPGNVMKQFEDNVLTAKK